MSVNFNFRENLSQCLSFSQLQMTSRDEWGEANFSKIASHLDALFALCRDLQSCPVEEVISPTLITKAGQKLHLILHILGKIDSFNPKTEVESANKGPDAIANKIVIAIDDFIAKYRLVLSRLAEY